MKNNKNKQNTLDSIFKPQKNLSGQQIKQNNIRKNNMNYTNINKNKGK